jgi:hypothetical protein
LIEHPKLFNAALPKDLRDLNVSFRDAKKDEYGGGYYFPPQRQIVGFTNRGHSIQTMRGLLEHETTHALSDDLGEPAGTSPKFAREKLNRAFLSGSVPQTQYKILRELSPEALYMAEEGEALARLAEARLQYSAEQRAKRPLALDVDLPLSMLWGLR